MMKQLTTPAPLRASRLRAGRGLASPSVLAMAVLALLLLGGCREQAAPPPQVPEVEVVAAASKDMPVYYEWVATLDGTVNATIRAQVQGYIIKRDYREGALVKKGQVLFEIDPRTFQAALDQAVANLEQQKAQWETAQANLKRIRPLAAQNAVSQKDLDEAIGSEQSRRASVLAAQAAVEKARLDLGFTRIVSPISGIAGIAKAQIGDLVGPGVTEELTTVSTVDPINATIGISEREYLEAFEKGQGAAEEGRVPLDLILSNGSVHPHEGHFIYANRQVDLGTGTIKVVARFANPGNYLRPGLFARVRARLAPRPGTVAVPQRSVIEVQGRFLVAVVGADNKADIRQVKVGQRINSDWLIEDGLQVGEMVVAEGIQKVRQGQVVKTRPYAPPAATATPTEQK